MRRPLVRATAARRAQAALLLALAGAACGRDSAARAMEADAAADSGETALPAMPAAILSRFDAPLEYDFTDVLKIVERVVPKSFGSLSTRKQIGDDRTKHYAYEATRGPFTAYASDSLIFLRTTLSYAVRAYFKTPIGATVSAGCGDDDAPPKITLELVTPLTLTSRWRLKSAARLSQMSPASDSNRDKCRVSFLQLDMTDRVIQAARAAFVRKLPDIDRHVARVDLTTRANGWWERLNRPIRLRDSVWLLLQPKQLRLYGVSGTAHKLVLRAGLDAYPLIVTGPRPRETVTPVPPLASDTGGRGFRLLIDGLLDYATASKALTEELRGKGITQAGHTVTVQTVVATPEPGSRLALMVTFTGEASGSLRFIGTPRHDISSGRVTVADLDYDLKTDSDLINIYTWLRSDVLRDFFRTRAQLSLAPVLEQAKELVTKGLNRTMGGVLTLNTVVDSLAVVNVVATARGFAVRARVSGDANLAVHTKQKRH